jgi:glycosyltransferase involved in cell wall biosynthesis
MFLAKDRKRFTQESLAALRRNTDWYLVDNFVLYDDGSVDGTLEFLREQAQETNAELRQTRLGSAVAAQNHFIERSDADFVAKCDNDAMYPPGWLDVALGVLERSPELQVICLEDRGIVGPLPYAYEGATEGDGLFVARREIFAHGDLPAVIRKYWGWETWMLQHHIKTGWLKPSLPVFLLDRVPFEPWLSLSAEYEAKRWQRPMPRNGAIHRYPMAKSYLWQWCGWPAGKVKVYRAAKPLAIRRTKLAEGEQIPEWFSAEWIRGLEARGDIRACMEQI